MRSRSRQAANYGRSQAHATRHARRTPHAVGDFDDDGVGDVGVSVWDRLTIHSGVDGHPIDTVEGVFFTDGSGASDFDRDGRDDLLVTRNVFGEAALQLGDDVWQGGRVEVLSGRDRSVLFELDGSALTPVSR